MKPEMMYRVTVRRTSTLEFDVTVYATSEYQALRVAEDPAEWLDEPDYATLVGDEEVNEIVAHRAEPISEVAEEA